MRSSYWFASRVMGDPVRNSAGETLGSIKDLIIDVNGRVDFALLTLDSFARVEDRLVAIPWTALGLLAGRDYVLLDMDKITLERAPMIIGREWPNFTDSTWRNRVYSYYGVADPMVAPAPVVARTPVVVEQRPRPRKEMSVLAQVFLVLVLLVMAGFAYLIATRGWDQARRDTVRSVYDVAYAMKETSADAALAAKVKMALSLNKSLPSHDINVDVSEGVVSLRGQVKDDQTRATAGKVAEDTPGVLQVHNELNVISPEK